MGTTSGQNSSAVRRWCFADQPGPHFLDHPDQPVLLIESRAVFERRRFHRRKAHLVLSALRHRAAELGDQAVFLQTRTYRDALAQVTDRISVCRPTSWAADRFVRSMPDVSNINVLPARGFCTPAEEFDDWANRQRTLLLENFYRDARRRFGLLMYGNEPAGGRWNFDADNREPAPKNADALPVPPPWQPDEDEIDDRVRAELDRWEREGAVAFIGRDGPREFPVTATEARTALQVFLRDRLPHFGPHEDAMLSGDRVMAHSLLSAPMNLGLLDPLECAYAAEDA
ncbi:MAG: cryptochrome/photolyase family protein [Mycobacterium sp.]